VNFFTGPAGSLVPIPSCTNVLVTATSATTATATCSYTPTATGAVTITAQYADVYHQPSSGSIGLTVAPPFDAAIGLTFGSTTLTYPNTTTETVCVNSGTSTKATGTVKLFDGSNLLTTQKLGSNGCVSWKINPPLGVGTHTLTASYSGDSNNPAGVSAPSVVTVSNAMVWMIPACGPNTVSAGSNYQCVVGVFYNLGFASGAITYSLDGGAPVSVPLNQLGLATFTISKPALGTHHVVLNYAAQGNFSAAGPQTETFNVVLDSVSVKLTASTKSSKSGKPVTFTAAVTSTCGTPPPSTGTVSFYNGSTLLTTVPVNGGGVATYTTSTLPVGNLNIKATYNGSTNYGTGSATVAVTITK
jgi:Bacterial Ig-like domain (group 3)